MDMQKRCQELQNQIDSKDAQLQAERKANAEKQLQIRREAEAIQKKSDNEYLAKITQL